MILIGALLTISTFAADSTALVRRVAATAQLAAQEYRIGVENGRVVAQAEVDEARLFLEESRRAAGQLPGGAAEAASLDSLLALVAALAPADTVAARVRMLSEGLARRFAVELDPIPSRTPSLARGAEIYQAACASCHGVAGRGDGPMAAGLDPAPADLAGWEALRDQSPLDYFRRISIGVAGTAMPAFEDRLPPEDRWAVALYATLLRLPAPAGSPPAALTAFPTTARMSDDAVLAALGTDDRARLASVRAVQEAAGDAEEAVVLARVRRQVDSARALADAGDPAAATAALDAYMTFEQVERAVRARDAGLAGELESGFAALRAGAAEGDAGAVAAARERLHAGLGRAESVLAGRPGPLNLFVQSFVILLREGLEAILIVGALLTFLVKTGAGHRRREVYLGIGAAVAASLLTAVALETVFRLSPAHQETLEGVTMVLAAAVLFYVSYWLLSKMEVVKWTHFVKSKVHHAVSSGSALALATAAFLAVYREGFETVLFYKALFLSSGGPGAVVPVVTGMLAGTVVLVAVFVVLRRFGVRLPLKPFFGVTSAFLYYMAFVFAGQGVAELQAGGLLPATPVGWAPRLPVLGIYPTVESLSLQAVLLVLLAAALVWTFAIDPRRLRISQVMVPDPVPPPPPEPAPLTGSGLELIRSLERMEADLAEMRAEVERMKRYVHDIHHTRSL